MSEPIARAHDVAPWNTVQLASAFWRHRTCSFTDQLNDTGECQRKELIFVQLLPAPSLAYPLRLSRKVKHVA